MNYVSITFGNNDGLCQVMSLLSVVCGALLINYITYLNYYCLFVTLQV